MWPLGNRRPAARPFAGTVRSEGRAARVRCDPAYYPARPRGTRLSGSLAPSDSGKAGEPDSFTPPAALRHLLNPRGTPPTAGGTSERPLASGSAPLCRDGTVGGTSSASPLRSCVLPCAASWHSALRHRVLSKSRPTLAPCRINLANRRRFNHHAAPLRGIGKRGVGDPSPCARVILWWRVV